MKVYNVGDAISFGDYEWRILDIKDHNALVITEYIIEHRSYHNTYSNITWAECSLREYLNGDFYHRFSADDQMRIVPVLNENKDNEWYGTRGGEDTQDNIFLLSTQDVVCNYFGDSSSKLYKKGKNQRYWFERKDENNCKRIAKMEANKERIWWWWLRSPGRVGMKAVYIHGDGNIGIQGNNVLKGNLSDGKCTGGVRPALWLKLDSN
ncbi:DUF6273 domain-containing protein [Enterocloster clostridioformis]